MCLRQNNVVSEVHILSFETYMHLNKLYAISNIECGCLWSFLLIKKQKGREIVAVCLNKQPCCSPDSARL